MAVSGFSHGRGNKCDLAVYHCYKNMAERMFETSSEEVRGSSTGLDITKIKQHNAIIIGCEMFKS